MKDAAVEFADNAAFIDDIALRITVGINDTLKKPLCCSPTALLSNIKSKAATAILTNFL